MPKKVQPVAQTRILQLLIMILESRVPIPLNRFSDPDEWGDERTFRRLRNNLNETWEILRGEKLFEIVDEDGNPCTKGEKRFIKISDTKISATRVERMAVMPALLQLLGIVKGTILSESYNHMYKDFRANLPAKQRRLFDRTEKKFFYFGKGTKDYAESEEILDEIYDALIKEQYLEITRIKAGCEEQQTVLPLTLILFNSGLYLACRFKDNKEKIYRFRIESFIAAKSLRGQHFSYPTDYEPQTLFEGSFGFINTQQNHEVVCSFQSNSWVSTYLKERKWTGSETYENRGSLTLMRMNVTDLREICSWLYSMGPDIKIESPIELKSMYLDNLRKINQIYDEDLSGGSNRNENSQTMR